MEAFPHFPFPTVRVMTPHLPVTAPPRTTPPYFDHAAMMRLRGPIKDWGWRWMVILAIVAAAFVGFMRMRIGFDVVQLLASVKLVGCYVAASLLFGALALRGGRRAYVFSVCADFFASLSQYTVLFSAGVALSYVGASTNFPLQDAIMARADALLGFDWHAMSDWIARKPMLRELLWAAYLSIPIQLLALFLVHALRGPGVHSGELLWCSITCLLLVVAIAIPLPALGHPGLIGQYHIDMLLAARAGTVDGLSGIVTFPSLHAASGVVLIHCARVLPPLLLISVPLNVMLILGTPLCGGHYLVDVIAGVGIGVGAIALVSAARRGR